jgi:hypothetical protein
VDGNATALHLMGFMYATGIGNAIETDQGAVKHPRFYFTNIGTAISYVRSFEWEHQIRNDSCLSPSHGHRNP